MTADDANAAPTPVRRAIRYADIDAAIADVEMLRRCGCAPAGNWTLAQVCRHLRVAIENTAKPAIEPATPEQAERRPALDRILATGQLPSGIQAPERAIPPPDCGDEDVDKLIAALRWVSTYPGPTASHRIFGPLALDDYRKLNLLHCAHHLGHLVPTATVDGPSDRPGSQTPAPSLAESRVADRYMSVRDDASPTQ